MRNFFSIYRAAAVEKAAGDWIARCDRGLSPREAEEFAAWEAADPRHAAELERLRETWRSLDTADEVPEIMRFARDLDDPAPRRTRRPAGTTAAWAALGAAAAVAMAWTLWQRLPQPVQTATATARYSVVPSSAQRLTLSDGTVVELNGDSAVEPAYSATERRVRLLRGEAHFAVRTDAARPFTVVVGDIAVHAVGTAFNVRFDAEVVEVLVTEGRVRVNDTVRGLNLLAESAAVSVRDDNAAGRGDSAGPGEERTPPPVPLLTAGQKAVISVAAPVVVSPVAVTMADIARSLAWQGTQFVFDRTPLAEAVAAFNSFNRLQLVLDDPSLPERRLGGTFRADGVEAFVRLLETGFDVQVERRGEHELVLRSAK